LRRRILGEVSCLPVLGAPAFDETDADGADARESIDGLESLVDGLVGELHKVGLVEYLQATTRRYLDHRGQMPIVALIAIRTLHEHRILAEAFGEHLAVLVAELQATADVVSRHLGLARAIHVGQDPEAEALRTRRIGVAVDSDRVRVARHVKHLTHSLLHLVVGQRTPVRLLDHRHRHHVLHNETKQAM
jgi:hypothetical protein